MKNYRELPLDSNSSRTVPLSERPLITFAILAYNQEHYIKDAIAGALAQSYSPLEIILSDDCSTDNTFSIMTDAATSYTGPHLVKARRSPQNRRLSNHINDVIAASSGSIIILAAGDDVSYPDRATLHANVYTQWPATTAVCSDHSSSADYQPEDYLQPRIQHRELHAVRHAMNLGGWGAGATYSYRRDVFTWPTPLPSDIDIEDRILPLRASIIGKVSFIKRKLIFYRTTPDHHDIARKRHHQDKQRKSLYHTLKYTIRSAHTEKKIGAIRAVALRTSLAFGFIRIRTKSRAERFPKNILLAYTSATLDFILYLVSRIHRISDFYSPLFSRK